MGCCCAGTTAVEGSSAACPIECVNGECKPISSPGHEGHYICECTPPFRGDSCSVQSAAATSSPQPSASRTPQPSARSTPQPTAVGNSLSTMQASSPYRRYNAAAHLLRSWLHWHPVVEASCSVLPLITAVCVPSFGKQTRKTHGLLLCRHNCCGRQL